MLKRVLDFCRRLDASSDKTTSTLTFLPSLDANQTDYELFEKNLAFPYEKCGFSETCYEPLK